MDGSSNNANNTTSSGTDQNNLEPEVDNTGKELGSVNVDGVEYKRYGR